MSDKIPPRCRGLCPLDELPDAAIPDGLLRNCKGPLTATGTEADRVAINTENGDVVRVTDHVLQLGEVSCNSAMAKEMLVRPHKD